MIQETERLFLLFLGFGIAAVVAGRFLTRMHWRDDIPPFSRRTPTLDMLMHPERFARAEAVAGIRALNLAGALLLAAAVGTLLREAVRR